MRRSAPLDFIAGAGGGHEGCGILLSRGTKVAIQPSMSRTGGSLLVPLALLLVITVLLYFHWGLRGQVSSFHVEREELREKLTTVQQERDAMAAQVHRFTEQLNLASQEKRGDDDQKKALSAKLDEAQVNIVSEFLPPSAPHCVRHVTFFRKQSTFVFWLLKRPSGQLKRNWPERKVRW